MSEYERGRRDGLEQAAHRCEKLLAAKNTSSEDNLLIRAAASIRALAATSGTPAPPDPERIVCEACEGVGCGACNEGYIYSEAAPPPADETLPAISEIGDGSLKAQAVVRGVPQASRESDTGGESYPGQAYVHKHNANIRRAEESFTAAQPSGARREGLERKIRTLTSHLRDMNTLYFQALDGWNAADDWWHKEWHQATGIPCDGGSEYCPLSRRAALAAAREPAAPASGTEGR
jgi:hypothetical protein